MFTDEVDKTPARAPNRLVPEVSYDKDNIFRAASYKDCGAQRLQNGIFPKSHNRHNYKIKTKND